ncbi:MAG: fibronectin type III domain-containing protein [Eubacterium sp.]|nr:fibronectin type III domain-containing protein [Eubacterium sp.]
MRKVSKKMIAVALSATMIVGSALPASAAVKNGTDVVATGKAWSGFSIYTHEDHKSTESKAKKNICWYHSLLDTGNILTDQHYVGDKVTDAQLKTLNDAIKADNKKKNQNNPTVTKHADTWGVQDSHKCFGENASITAKSGTGFDMNVVSTGWSATWTPMGTVAASNPWGVTATKIINVDRGRTYKVSFKIKSTLKNELEKEVERKDKTYYNNGTGKFNYVKHIHFKLFDDTDKDGAALKLKGLKATQGGKNVSETSKKLLADYANFIKLDSSNTADDGWVNVSFSVKIPSSLATYQKKKKQATIGFKFAFGAFLKEFIDENNMSGTISVRDMKFVAAKQGPVAPAKIKTKSVKKTSFKVSFKKATAAKKYEVQYGTKYDKEKGKVKGGKILKATKKKTIKIKKLKAGKKYYVRVRSVNGKEKSDWSLVAKVKTKK